MSCKPKFPKVYRYQPKPKKQKSRTLWRSGRVIKKGPDMRQLREQAFARSDGYCENPVHAQNCPKRIFWGRFDLHHLKSRSHGGSDVLENVACLSFECHRFVHGMKVA